MAQALCNLKFNRKVNLTWGVIQNLWNEPPHDKTNKMACVPSEDSDQPGHPPSLIRIFAVHMKKAWVLSYQLSAQRRLWSDWADAQADLSSLGAHAILLVLSCRGSNKLSPPGAVLSGSKLFVTVQVFYFIFCFILFHIDSCTMWMLLRLHSLHFQILVVILQGTC